MDLFGSGLEQVETFLNEDKKALVQYHGSYFSTNEE